MKASDATRYKELLELLEKYWYEYYVLDQTTVSDAVYDGLIAEVKAIEGTYPDEIAYNSPTQRVGGVALDKFEKYTHSQRMISLLDCFSDEEARAWLERIAKLDDRVRKSEFWVDSKKDGLACALHYKDG